MNALTVSVRFLRRGGCTYDQRARDKAVVVNVEHQIDMIQRDKAIMKRVVGRVLE